ncbi:energy transducer TonB [Hymenobacter aerilatus]|uniref:Energy transducer TonB n=1 Tax=Hymenobacter aerilatus TaxID=2932251 RepID=A0A8T9STS5_9BACT|nr:energy transducer TonB [Hymenobacter aerilatus]UOR05137.1 energy transducer TonB [Hymenobacter aerilatus]
MLSTFQAIALPQLPIKLRWFWVVLLCGLGMPDRDAWAQVRTETQRDTAVYDNSVVLIPANPLPIKEYDLPINLPKPVYYPGTICFFGAFPEFPGGFEALFQFIGQNIRYSADTTITGKVFVSFVITETGQVANAHINKGLSPAFYDEVLRVIKSMPKWKPGENNGKPVSVPFTIPVGFAKDLPPTSYRGKNRK